MGDLARQVNHDVKNGLVPIRNVLRHFDEVARDQPASLAELYRERRGTLESSVAYLETLARNYARISPAPSREPCDVNALVEQLVHGGDPGGRLSAALGTAIPSVAADRLMLRRVLENLIGNAVESLDGREGRVTVSTEAVRAGAGVRITVADTGRGMSREELDRAFDDFFTTKPGGTGLGLSIVRRLVLDLGGTLRIETEPGAGTRVVDSGGACRCDDAGVGGGRLRRRWPSSTPTTSGAWVDTRCSLPPTAPGVGADRRGAGGLRDPRPRDAGDGRLRGPPGSGAEGHRSSRDRLHRDRQLRTLHAGGPARRLRLRGQG